jgi:hypothetical protein
MPRLRAEAAVQRSCFGATGCGRPTSIFVVRLTVLENVRQSERRIDQGRAQARGKE